MVLKRTFQFIVTGIIFLYSSSSVFSAVRALPDIWPKAEGLQEILVRKYGAIKPFDEYLATLYYLVMMEKNFEALYLKKPQDTTISALLTTSRDLLERLEDTTYSLYKCYVTESPSESGQENKASSLSPPSESEELEGLETQHQAPAPSESALVLELCGIMRGVQDFFGQVAQLGDEYLPTHITPPSYVEEMSHPSDNTAPTQQTGQSYHIPPQWQQYFMQSNDSKESRYKQVLKFLMYGGIGFLVYLIFKYGYRREIDKTDASLQARLKTLEDNAARLQKLYDELGNNKDKVDALRDQVKDERTNIYRLLERLEKISVQIYNLEFSLKVNRKRRKWKHGMK